MNAGSRYVLMYDHSDEEYLSETELNEGMWLSESSDEEEGPPMPTLTLGAAKTPSKPIEIKVAEGDQPSEGSATKYLSLQDDSKEPSPTPPPPPAQNDPTPLPPLPPSLQGADKGSESDTEDSGDEAPVRKNYVDVEYVDEMVAAARAKPKPRPKTKLSGGAEDVTYVKISELKTKEYQKPPSPPPPPRPPKGIIRNRLTQTGVKKQKRARVQWDRDPTLSHRRRGHFSRRVDTNVLAVKFNTLVEPSDVHTGDSVVCGNANCTAILSHLSSLKDHKDPDREEKVWECEFCGAENEVDIVPEEMPIKEDTTFMIAPPTSAGGAGQGGGVEDSLVVFCVDVSGSMCVSTEVPGKFKLKGHERVRGDLSSHNVRGDQYLPGQSRNTTYVSRLQSVQAAVDHQLTLLASGHPSNKVALVTFGDEVTVIGDGRGRELTLAGDKLWDLDTIVKVGGEIPLPGLIKDTHKKLSKRVFGLEEGGQTALGPALLLSITMAAKIPGSKVIFCTDGLANKGVGNLDDLQTAQERGEAQTFYENMGTLALEKNVTVSLVRIKGTDCKATELGQVANKTGGQVTTVNPLNITKEFTSILANPVIATNVRAKIVLHRELYFRTEESQESMLLIPVGNVTADHELTYEYGVRTKKNRAPPPLPTDGDGATASGESPKTKRLPPLKIDGKDHLPFQLQIEYTGRDGSRCVRVISQAKPVTTDRTVAEKDMDMGVVGSHVARNTAKLTMEGEYTGARLHALKSQRLMQRNSRWNTTNRLGYENFMEDLIPLERRLATKQETERYERQHSYSDDEDQYDVMFENETPLMQTELAAQPQQPRVLSRPKTKKAVERRGEMEDELAVYCYNMSAAKSHEYTNVPVDQSPRKIEVKPADYINDDYIDDDSDDD